MASDLERLVVIGDVHGEADRLMNLLLRPECLNRRKVFVGDLINRGPSSRRVLEIVRWLRTAVIVRGNHEQALLDVLNGGAIAPLLVLGGAPTVLDYVGVAEGDVAAQLRGRFPKEHYDLLAESVRNYRQGHLLVTHDGGVSSAAAPTAAPSIDLPTRALKPPPGEFWAFGHYPQSSKRPLTGEQFVCLDTGAGIGGPITAVLWPERAYLQG